MFIITGGGTGIGRALALQLSVRNQHVLIVGRRKEPLQEVASHSPFITTLSADVGTADGRQKIIDYTHNISSLQGLIHCAGMIQPIMPVCDIGEEQWHALMSVNLDAPLFLTQALLDKLGNGRVLQMASKMADDPVKGMAAYCTSKAALKMLIRCWQLDSLVATMALTSAMPGVVYTDMPQQVLDATYIDEPLRKAVRKLKQQNRLILPETVALFLTWLLLDTDKAIYISKAWDIYDTSHHSHWLIPPHQVPLL